MLNHVKMFALFSEFWTSKTGAGRGNPGWGGGEVLFTAGPDAVLFTSVACDFLHRFFRSRHIEKI